MKPAYLFLCVLIVCAPLGCREDTKSQDGPNTVPEHHESRSAGPPTLTERGDSETIATPIKPTDDLDSKTEQPGDQNDVVSSEKAQRSAVITGINDENFRRIRDGLLGTPDTLRDVEKLFGARGKSLDELNRTTSKLPGFYWDSDTTRYVVRINDRKEVVDKNRFDLSDRY